jgi:hypothetical protein
MDVNFAFLLTLVLRSMSQASDAHKRHKVFPVPKNNLLMLRNLN